MQFLTGLPEIDIVIAAQLERKNLVSFFCVNHYAASLDTDLLWRMKLARLLDTKKRILTTKRPRAIYRSLSTRNNIQKQLEWLIAKNQTELALILLDDEHVIDLYYKDDRLLHDAISAKNRRIVETLLSLRTIPLQSNSLIIEAMGIHDLDILRLILDSFPPEKLTNLHERVDLVDCAFMNTNIDSFEMIKLCIERGIDFWKIINDEKLAMLNSHISKALFDRRLEAPLELRSRYLDVLMSDSFMCKIYSAIGNVHAKNSIINVSNGTALRSIFNSTNKDTFLEAIQRLLDHPFTVLTLVDCLRAAIRAGNLSIVVELLSNQKHSLSSEDRQLLIRYAHEKDQREIERFLNQEGRSSLSYSSPIINGVTLLRERLYDLVADYLALMAILWAVLLLLLLGNI